MPANLSPTVNVAPLLPGDPSFLGRHALLGRLGQGGMGVVYLADGPIGRIAVKTIHSHLADNAAFHARFQHEVQACFRVRGPHTAELVDFDVTGSSPWLATEFVDAPDLEQRVKRDGPLSPDAQFALALGLADALAGLHASGIVHRDLKPSNVLCSATGPRVIDFGIAAAVDDAGLTGTGEFVGTTAWMAPERITGSTTSAADIYAWGALVAYAATGRPLFEDATPLQLMMAVAGARPDVDYHAIDPRLRDAVASCLNRSPEFRPTAAQLRDALTNPAAEPAVRVDPPWLGATRVALGPQTAWPPARTLETHTAVPDRHSRRGVRSLVVNAAAVLLFLGGIASLMSAVLPWSLNWDETTFDEFPVGGFSHGSHGFISVPASAIFLATAVTVFIGRRRLSRPATAGLFAVSLVTAVWSSIFANAVTGDVDTTLAGHHLFLIAALGGAAFPALIGIVATLLRRRSPRR